MTIGWIILSVIGGLLLIVTFLLCCSVTAHIDYKDDFKVKVKYLFFKIYPKKSKKKKIKYKKKKQKLTKKIEQKQSITSRVAKESGMASFAKDISKANERSFDFQMLKLIYDSAKPAMRNFIGKLRVTNVQLNCIVGGDDAAKIALTYGFQSAAVSAGLAWLNEVLTLKIKKVDVTADFNKPETELTMKCKIKIRVGAAVICMLQFIIRTAKNSKSNPKQSKKPIKIKEN
jgi:hypothetical protein